VTLLKSLRNCVLNVRPEFPNTTAEIASSKMSSKKLPDESFRFIYKLFRRSRRIFVVFSVFYVLLTAPDSSSTAHIYTQTIHRTTQSTQTIHKTTQLTNWEEDELCPVFASYTLATEEKAPVRVAEECQLARWKQNVQNRTEHTLQ